MYYLIILFILLSFAIVECFHINRTTQNTLLSIGAIITCLTAGLRYETGGDWNIYEIIFNNIQTSPLNLDNVSNIEKGYLILNIIVKELGGSIQAVFLIVSIINTCLLVKCLNEYIPERRLLGLFIYYSVFFFALEMLYTRQSTSLLICIYSMKYIKRRKFIRFSILVAIAFLFHRMSILILPLYFVVNKRISNQLAIIITGIGMLIMGANINWFIPLYLKTSSLLGDVFYQKALLYISDKEFAVARVMGIGYFLNAFLLGLFIWRRHDIERNPVGNIFFNLYIVSLVVYYYFYELVEVSMRIRFYFFVSIVFLLPIIIENSKNIVNRLVFILVTIVYSVTYNRHILFEQPSGAAYNPYQNYIIYKYFDKRSTGEERLDKSITITKEDRAKQKDQ